MTKPTETGAPIAAPTTCNKLMCLIGQGPGGIWCDRQAGHEGTCSHTFPTAILPNVHGELFAAPLPDAEPGFETFLNSRSMTLADPLIDFARDFYTAGAASRDRRVQELIATIEKLQECAGLQANQKATEWAMTAGRQLAEARERIVELQDNLKREAGNVSFLLGERDLLQATLRDNEVALRRIESTEKS